MNKGIPNRIQELIIKHLTKGLSVGENAELDEWLDSSEENRLFFAGIEDRQELKAKWADYNEANEYQIWEKLSGQIPEFNSGGRVKLRVNQWKRYAAAAAVIGIVSIAGWYFLMKSAHRKQEQNPTIASTKNDVQPGGNKAVLTLANGSKIVLDSAHNGSLAKQGGTVILKEQDQVTYEQNQPEAAEENLYNTIATPRGGQYHLILADGSKVWLNAASSIRFPVYFTTNERKVEISGEVYFEIAKDRIRPFKVIVTPEKGDNRCEIEVLGTHFDVNAYADESHVKTTLLEGRIKLTPYSVINTKVLSPGQQAILNKTDNNVKVINHEDAESSIAWMKNQFHFENANLEDVMRQLSRWYDVEIIYETNTVQKVNYTGDVERNIPLSVLLGHLEKMSTTHYKIEGRTVKVVP